MKTNIKNWVTALVALIIGIFSFNVNAQTTEAYPADMAFLSSEAALRAYAVENSRTARVWVGMSSSTAGSGSYGAAWDKGLNSVDLFSRIDSLFDNLWIQSFNPNDYIWTSAATQTSDGDDLLYGGGGACLEYGKGGYNLPHINNWFYLASTIQIPFDGVESVRALVIDQNGRTSDWDYLQVKNGKFGFRSDMAGKVILEIKTKDGKTLAYNLTKGGISVLAETVFLKGKVSSSLDHMIVLRDFVGPYKYVEPSYRGIGTNPTFEVIVTTKEISLDLSVSSSEGAKPTGFRVKKQGAAKWSDVIPAVDGGRITSPPMEMGTYYIVPVWDPKEFRSRQPYIYYGDDGGKG